MPATARPATCAVRSRQRGRCSTKPAGYSVVLGKVEDEERKKKEVLRERRKHQHERVRYG